MNRRTGQSGISRVLLIIIGVILLAGIALVVYLNSGSKSTTTTSTKKTASNSFKINEWGVSVDLPETVKSVSYVYDDSNTLFFGPIARITSITTNNGATFKQVDTTQSQSNAVDGICGYLAIGRMSDGAYIDPITKATVYAAAHTGDYYFYTVPQPIGTTCKESEAAAQAAAAVKLYFATVHK